MAEQTAAPTPKEVDALIVEYSKAQGDSAALAATAKVLSGKADEIKVRLTAMVEQFGARHTEKSKRLDGLNGHTATTTTSTPTVIMPDAVERFLHYLTENKMARLLKLFFERTVVYSLVAAPAAVLQDLKLTDEVRETLAPMVALCFEVKKNAPGLKVECAAVGAKAA